MTITEAFAFRDSTSPTFVFAGSLRIGALLASRWDSENLRLGYRTETPFDIHWFRAELG
jgi:hypothetical protein